MVFSIDHLGSIIAITDEIGSIVEEYSYDVFGKPYTKKSDGTITKLKKSPIGNTRMYTGREYALTEGRKCPWGVNRGLKLYYNRARYYNPQFGRFISRDPIDIADDVNLYAYVGNNSVMFVDLMGTEKTLIIGFMGKEDSNYGGEVGLDYGNSGSLTMLNYFSDTNTVKAYKSDHFGNSVDEALNYINNKEFNKIIILGHSLGGDNAINLVNKLDSNNINVELLITLDIKSFYENDTITNNVNYAYNYHQSIDESSNLHGIRVLDGEDIEKSLFNNNSNIKNMNIESYNGHKISHTNIDDLLVDEVVKIINNHK